MQLIGANDSPHAPRSRHFHGICRFISAPSARHRDRRSAARRARPGAAPRRDRRQVPHKAARPSPRARSARNPFPAPLIRQNLRRGGAQPAFRPIAHHRIADLAAGGEPDPHAGAARRIRRPRRGLQDQTGHDRFAAIRRDPQEIGPDLERCKSAGHEIPGCRGRASRIAGSGGQPLAALCPARGHHAAAGDGRHPRAKPVTALANEFAGLVSALHGTGSDCGISFERRRLYRGGGPAKSTPAPVRRRE